MKPNVLYCGDANIRDGVLVSVLSLIANQPSALSVYIATAQIDLPGKAYRPVDDRFARALDALVREERPGSSVTLVDATGPFCAQPPAANMATRFTPFCMLRLYADLLPQLEGEDRLLYLDNDVLCKAPFDALYAADMHGAEIGGVPDRYGRLFFHNELRIWDYLNSGVLLLDMGRIRETGLLRKCREMCASKKMFMPDQSALNKLAKGKHQFPRRYNEQRKLHGDTVFQHFTTRFTATGTLTVKPWDVDRVHGVLGLHAYDGILERYLDLKPDFID